MGNLSGNLAVYVIGSTIHIVYVAYLFCPDMTKLAIFSVLITIWVIPIHCGMAFSGFIFMQLGYSLYFYFKGIYW